MSDTWLLLLFAFAPLVAIGVSSWIGSGVTAVRPGLGMLTAFLGGIVATLAIDWFVGSRESMGAVLIGTQDRLAFVGAIACLVLAALLSLAAAAADPPG